MNSDWHTLILGIVQGATEFLPISSSGHLALLQISFGLKINGLLAFDLILHCATMIAVLLFFRDDIAVFIVQWLKGFFIVESRKSEGWLYGWAILAGSAITSLIALPLKDLVETVMLSHLAIGIGLLVTAGLLFIAPLFSKYNKINNNIIKVAIIVGLAQGIAIFPGVSRSGATIAAALFMGLTAAEAFRLSFLMSIPVIFGASLLEARHINSTLILPEGWIISAIAAFIVGYFALILLRKLVLSGKWAYFGVYCFFLGLFAIVSDIVTRF